MTLLLDTLNLFLRWFGLILTVDVCPTDSQVRYATELRLTTRRHRRRRVGTLVGDPGWAPLPLVRPAEGRPRPVGKGAQGMSLPTILQCNNLYIAWVIYIIFVVPGSVEMVSL